MTPSSHITVVRQVMENILLDFASEWGELLAVIIGLAFAFTIAYMVFVRAFPQYQGTATAGYNYARDFWTGADIERAKDQQRFERQRLARARRIYERDFDSWSGDQDEDFLLGYARYKREAREGKAEEERMPY